MQSKFTNATLIADYEAQIYYYELGVYDTYPFLAHDVLDFSDCEIFQTDGICTFSLIIDQRKCYAYIPSRCLLFGIVTFKRQ
jgi:hypothetical protein